MRRPPCKDCPDRRVGCHDPEVCQKWANFRAEKPDLNESEADLRDYIMRSVARYKRERRWHKKN